MSDENQQETPPAADNGQSAPENLPRLAILTQYVKDFSFENPNAPASLIQGNPQPNINVSVDVQARRSGEQNFEVDLHISIEAKQGDNAVFMTELVYSALFTLENIPQENLQPVLLIECPRLIFPFARRIIADATRDGGFPPLMLDPIDFAQLYQQQIAAAQAQAAEANQPN